MANLNSGTSGYPAALDTSPDLTDGSSGDEIVSAHLDGRGAAIVAIETELGTDPAGSTTDVKTRLAVALNDDGTVKSTVIVANTPTSVSYASGVFTLTTTPARYLSGNMVQMVVASVTGFTTTANNIPYDNTPILSTEGVGLGLSVDMKPTSTLNSVYVRGDLFGAVPAINNIFAFGLFLAGSSSAIMAGSHDAAGENMMNLNFTWKATTVSTATTTYALNVGSNSGTLTLNGFGSAGLYGNRVTSLLTVFEVQN